MLDELIEFLITAPEYPIESFENGNVVYHKPTQELQQNILCFEKLYPFQIKLALNLIKYMKDFEIQIPYSFICKYYNNFIINIPLVDVEKFKCITWQYDIVHNNSISMFELINNAINIKKKKKKSILEFFKRIIAKL